MRIPIATVEVVEGPLYHVVGEDEQLTCFTHGLIATDTTGREWVHYFRFTGHVADDDGINRPAMALARPMAEELALEVRRRGTINPEYWTICEEGMSLEKRWEAFGHEYQREREEAGIR